MQNIDRVKRNGRIKPSIFDYIISFGVLFFFIMFWLVASSLFLSHFLDYLLGNELIISNLIIFSVTFFLSTLVLIRSISMIPGRLRLHTIVENLNDNINKEAVVENALKRLQWTYYKVSDHEYHATTGYTIYSFGQEITILYFEDKILANSVDYKHALIFNSNKKNIAILKKVVHDILRNPPLEIKK
ncbi:MAG: hypothetical protein WD048_11060 [Chitinophagales bacterium]